VHRQTRMSGSPVYNIFHANPFADYAARVQERLERDYGIPVITRDIPDPLTGDLDGAEIDVDYAITAGAAPVFAGPPVWPHRAVERE